MSSGYAEGNLCLTGINTGLL